MSQTTGIEWTDRSSNPLRYRDAAGNDVWACVKKSAGCANCYAEATALRFGKGTGFTAANMRKLAPYVREKEMKELLSPKKTPAGSKVFVCDMTDLFGDWVPFELADRLFAAFALRPDVVFQVLTKRPDRMADYLTATDLDERLYAVVSGWLDDGAKGLLGREWDRCHAVTEDATEDGPRPDAARWRLPLPNVRLGTSVENQAAADERIQATLPDGWRCDLSLASYSHGSVPTYGVALEHDSDNIRTYGSGSSPADALEEARRKVQAEYEKRAKTPRLTAPADVKPAALPPKRKALT